MDLTSSPKPIAYFTPVENVTSDSSTMDVTFNTPPVAHSTAISKDIHSKATSVQEDKGNKMKNTSNEMSTESECESSYVYGKSPPVAVNQQSSSSCTTSYESSYVFGNSPPPVPVNSQTDDCTAIKSPEKDKSTVAVQSPKETHPLHQTKVLKQQVQEYSHHLVQCKYLTTLILITCTLLYS